MLPRSRVSRRGVLASLGTAPLATMLVRSAAADAAPQPEQAGQYSGPQAQAVLCAMLEVSLATPVDATVGSAIILGGTVEGELAGAVQPGSLAWTRDPLRGVLQLDARFELQTGEGLRIHVADRATVETPASGCWTAAFNTTTELTVVDGSPSACPESVYVGRMDASQIQSGRLRLTVHRIL